MVQRQDELAERLSRVEAALNLRVPAPLAPAPAPLPVIVPIAKLEPEPPPPPPLHPVLPPPPPQDLESSIGLTLVNRIGAVTLIIGIAFFFKWAVDNNWIGPAGRVMLGLLAGLAAIAVADVLWRRGQKVFAQGLTATGAAILYIALFSAYGFYQLVPAAFAFVAMAAVSVLAAALALRYGTVAIAGLALFGAYLTPILLNSNEDKALFLFGYLLLLAGGSQWLSQKRGWWMLEFASLAGTILLYIAWWSAHFQSEKHAVCALFLLALLAVHANSKVQPVFVVAQIFIALALRGVEEKSPETYFVLALPIAAAGLAVAAQRKWRAAVTAAFAGFWWVSGWLAEGLTPPRPTSALFLGFSAGYLLFLGWTPWWLIVKREAARVQDLAVLALNGIVYFGLGYWLLNPSNHSAMGLFAIALAAVHLGLGYELWRRQDPATRQEPPVLLSIGVAFAFLTLAVPIQFAAWRITMAWALEGAALSWIAGRFNNRRMLQAGAALFVLAVYRLIIIDAWIFPQGVPYSLVANQRFLTFLITALCLWLAAMWTVAEQRLARGALYFAGHFAMLWALTQEAIAWAGRTAESENLVSVETISVSILYAIYAVMFIGIGVSTRSVINRVAGLGLIGVVVLKLYLFDVWQLGKVYRTLAFVALGVLLLLTSFLYSRFRGVIDSLWKNDDEPKS